MKKQTLSIVAIGLLAASGAFAQDKYTDGVTPLPPGVNDNLYVPEGSLTFYADRASFQAANPGLPLEDFSATSVPNASVLPCLGPLSSTTNDACFSTGSVIPGFDLTIVDDGGGDTDYVVLNNVLTPCVAVGPNTFVNETDWNFNPAIAAVAWDFYSEAGGNSYTVEIFGPGGSLGSTPVVGPGGGVAAFFGVDSVDPGGITRIEVREAVDSSGDLFCDLEFGGGPVPVELQNFDVE